MMKKIIILICLLTAGLTFRAQDHPDTLYVYYLGGQSNMDGYGNNQDLPSALDKTFENVWIFHGNQVPDDQPNGGSGIWSQLQPGHGAGFASNGITNQYSDRFGIELSFARRLNELYPNRRIAIIKYSRGGTSLDSLGSDYGCWEPDYQGTNGINQYDNFLATIRNATAVKDIDGDGTPDFLQSAGIVWMQGESDSPTEEIASRYFDHLKRLMDLIRAALRTDDLPVVIGKISDSGQNERGKVWDYGELVQYAQEEFAKTDGHAAIVRTTAHYGYSDPWHYDSEGYIDLGRAFADAMYRLEESAKTTD
ncbi:MAG: sialate O-acetylesterase [bacterium]